ncbi:GPN-loop GTPase [Nematocida homosporus]|uniref:GPN-loop GTPase n=1 Tax=Nematocida homosporus TaxID=1912981 RepID=UPI00222061BE|nr:GPN-loop GTPase [Nematocida homosporus]KAI5185118.1 GPN-loop GTPase [Nematocida homosporus]
MGCGVFVIGPAGSGKTTLCQVLREYYVAAKRRVVLVNLDPAQMHEDFDFDIDIRDHLSLMDVMEEADFGPNGGLLAGVEAVADNLDILELPEEEDAFMLFDCPGQIELYIHSESIKRIVENVQKCHTVMMVYALDATHVLEMGKFVAGAISATIAMAKFEVPHMNVFTKCDLVGEEEIEEFLYGLDKETIHERMGYESEQENRFNMALATIISDNGLLGFYPIDYKNEQAIEDLTYQIDACTQYLESQEPQTKE